MKLKKSKKGFTIIEVVLVLAIAGLIFLMVFVALPALQRSQRNTQRKEDMTRIAAQIVAWMKNNRKALNDSAGNADFKRFYDTYMEPADEYTDPLTGQKYVAALWNQSTINGEYRECDIGGSLDYEGNVGDCWHHIEVGEFQYDNNATCSSGVFDDKAVANVGRSFAIRYRFEGGGYACISDLGH